MRTLIRALEDVFLKDVLAPAEHSEAIEAARYETIDANAPISALYGLFSTIVLAVTFWNQPGMPFVFLWGAISAFMAIARTGFSGWLRGAPSAQKSRRFLIYSAAIGSAWGAVLAVMFPLADAGQSAVLCGLAAASMCVCALVHSTSPLASLGSLVSISAGACIGLVLSHQLSAGIAAVFLWGCAVLLQRLTITNSRRFVASYLDHAELRAVQEKVNTLSLKSATVTSDWVWRTDAAGRLVECSTQFVSATGLPLSLLEGGSFLALFAPASARQLGTLLGQRLPFRDEVMQFQTDMAEGWWQVSGEPAADGGWRGAVSDITRSQETEARIAYVSEYDSLTELPNRAMLIRQLGEALEAASPSGDNVALFVIDLDHFKTINDTQGHPSGDVYLQVISRRLRDCIDQQGFLARLGGDEFAIIQNDMGPEEAVDSAELIVDALLAPVLLNGREVLSSGSIGIAIAPGHGSEPAVVMKNAELALYRAKAQGRGCARVYDASMEEDARVRADLEADLRNALATEAMEIYFQPLVNTQTRAIAGYETLLRWNRPGHGLVSPSTFISCAEETGIIVPLGEWVIRRAISEAAQWRENLQVAVNLSPAQMKNPALLPTVVGALAASQLDPSRLEIEIVESVLMDETENNLRMLHALRELGVKIALDDFGTGYSSLSYLCAFPFDKIKIDQRFVRDIDTSKENQAIVRAIISLAHDLRMRVTAEGVENVEQAAMLSKLGCTEVQGYLYSRPVPATELAKKDAAAVSGNIIHMRRRA